MTFTMWQTNAPVETSHGWCAIRIANGAVYGIPHGDWGETVVAAIVPKIRHVLNANDVSE